MMIESLESRRLLTTTVSFSAGVVSVTANKEETINVVENNGAVHVEIGNNAQSYDFVGATAVKINTATSSKKDTIWYTGNSIGASITGGNGPDNISVDDEGTGSSSVHGGGNNDAITVQNGNNTSVAGDDGNDLIYVYGGTSNIDAGKGNDTVTLYGGSGTANGGNGTDTLIYGPDSTAVFSTTGFENTIPL